MTKYLRESIAKVDKVDKQAKNAGFQDKVDNLCFCFGSQGLQGLQVITGGYYA